jgi:D-alanyl-lipoteichoic acid acyltransferase DltB (MBOAT superfamily)
LISYVFAIILEHKSTKLLLTLGVILTLTPLAFFKYSNFILTNINSLLSYIGIDEITGHFSFIIPVGISFFTFQALSYLIDVYRRDIKAEHNFIDYMLFVSFFPQIVAGPISKAGELLPQIKNNRQLKPDVMVSGFKMLLWGYFLKLVLADRLGIYVDQVYNNYQYLSGWNCFVGSLLYSLQIYGDFAGYSLMAVGTGRLFGFRLINNFRQPYLATSVSDFWHRWNISLSRWLKDYIYIPLGGNRRGKVRTYFNIIFTFLVSGLWHGANWSFIFWGAIHGIAQCIEKFFGWNSLNKKGWRRIFSIIITFTVVNLAWIFFRMPEFTNSLQFLERIFTLQPGRLIEMSGTKILIFIIAIVAVIIKDISDEYNISKLSLIHSRYMAVRWITYIVILTWIMLFGIIGSSQFIYVSF